MSIRELFATFIEVGGMDGGALCGIELLCAFDGRMLKDEEIVCRSKMNSTN